MAIKVLVVDDSNFFCRRVAQILTEDPDIKVVGIANNGKEAVAKAQSLKPDLITLDVEMPVMDGITALKHIMSVQPTPVLMLSSLTYEGAKLTLDALDSGAVDFMLKSYEGISQGNSSLSHMLRNKVKEIAGSSNQNHQKSVSKTTRLQKAPEQDNSPQFQRRTSKHIQKGSIKLIAIGASTGGPVALQKILSGLPGSLSCPIVVTQHMPGTFTGAFAKRMDGVCQLNVYEAENTQALSAGNVYIAPGGKQMYIEGNPAHAVVRVRDTDKRLQYAPCVDVTFASAAKVFGGNVLGIVLTGMGADGCEGAGILRKSGAQIWVQDETSCVVYGMPGSAVKAGVVDLQVPLEQMAEKINQVV